MVLIMINKIWIKLKNQINLKKPIDLRKSKPRYKLLLKK
jgi:hypothetical protein